MPKSALILAHPEPRVTPGCRPHYTRSEARTRKGEPVCPQCGTALYARRVIFAVLPWRGDNRYNVADAIATYTRESAADAHASRLYAADSASPYVARTLPA